MAVQDIRNPDLTVYGVESGSLATSSPDHDENDTVTLLEPNCPLNEEQLQVFTGKIDPLSNSSNFEVDIYLRVVNSRPIQSNKTEQKANQTPIVQLGSAMHAVSSLSSMFDISDISDISVLGVSAQQQLRKKGRELAVISLSPLEFSNIRCLSCNAVFVNLMFNYTNRLVIKRSIGFDYQSFGNRTFDCVRLAKLYCEFDRVRQSNDWCSIGFDCQTVRLDRSGKLHCGYLEEFISTA